MKRPCLLMRRWRWFALLLIPVAAWGVVLVIAPTGWARARLVDRLSRASGRSVKIGELRLGPLGDLRVMGLAIAEPGTPDNPWLEVREARMDVHLGQILCGHCEPREVVVEGVSLRLWRKADGSTEIGDLIHDRSGTTHHSSARSALGELPGLVTLRINDGAVRVIDEPSGTRLELTNLIARATWGRRLVSIDEMKGTLNGGTLALAAKLDRDPACPRFQAEIRASAVEIDGGSPVLGLLAPVVAGATDGVGGKFDLMLALKGQGSDRAEIRRTLRGNGSVVLDPIDLEGSKLLAQLAVLGDLPRENQIGSVATDFIVEHGRIKTDELTIRASRFPFVLGGWADFDGNFDYSAKVDRIMAKLPREAKPWIAELKVNFEQLAGLRMFGSLDHVEVTVHGHPLTGDPDRPDGERARFRDTARRIRDQFFR